MPYDVLGRPSAEILSERAIATRSVPRPFSDFGHVGTVDDTATIQAAIDWSSIAGNGPVGQAGTFIVNGLVVKSLARIICPGEKHTIFQAKVGMSAAAVFLSDTGPIQYVEMSGFTIKGVGTANGKHGIYFKAVPVAGPGGGFWYARFKDIFITDIDGESFWLRGYGNVGGDPFAFMGPHQFIKFERVIVAHGNAAGTIGLGTRALRLSGMVGQVGFDEDCEFDYQTGANIRAGTNILLERDVADDNSNRSDLAPYDIQFRGVTCQGRVRGVTIERASNVSFIGGHFENVYEGILNSVSAQSTRIEGTAFYNVGYKGDGTGYGVKNAGGIVTVANLNFASSSDPVACETHYISSFGQPIYLRGSHYDSIGIRTSGLTTAAIAAAATLNIDQHELVFVNGPSATAVTTLNSSLGPDARVTLRANAGYILIANGGNLDIAPYQTPLRIRQNACVTFIRNDLTGVWKLISIGAPDGNLWPVSAGATESYVNTTPFAMTPDMGQARVDATSGNKVVKLPPAASCPLGLRLSVRKLDTSANVVYVNGDVTAENPDGYPDNAVSLTKVEECYEFERNSTPGWDIVGGWLAHSVTRVLNSLTPGTHMTGGVFDGSAPVTIATDATSVNTANTIVARNGSGNFVMNDLTARLIHTSGAIDITNNTGGYGLYVQDSVDHAAMVIKPATGFIAWIDQGRIGSVLNFRQSNISGGDTLWLSVTAAGAATLLAVAATSVTLGGATPLAGWFVAANTKGLIVANSSGGNKIGIALDISNIWQIGDGLSIQLNSSLVNVVINQNATTTLSVTNTDGTNSSSRAKITVIGNAISGEFVSIAGDALYIGASTSSIVRFMTNGSEKFRLNTDGTVTFSSAITAVLGHFGGAVDINNTTGGYALYVQDSTGNVAMKLQPASNSYVAFIDQTRIGSQLTFRQSAVSGGDRTWLDVNPYGNVVFKGDGGSGTWAHEIQATTVGNPNGLLLNFTGAAPNNTTQILMSLGDYNGAKMVVWSNGNVVNANNSYGAISDARLKTIYGPAGSQMEDFRRYQFQMFTMHSGVRNGQIVALAQESHMMLGVVADEMLVVSPGLVERDGYGFLSVKYSVLAVKTARLGQELVFKFDELDARFNNLAARVSQLEAASLN